MPSSLREQAAVAKIATHAHFIIITAKIFLGWRFDAYIDRAEMRGTLA